MSKVTNFLIRYPIWTTVLMVSVLIFGMLSMLQMRYSFFPELTPDLINITVAYPGASPEEVAEGVVLKIEEQLEGLAGVDRVTSVSRENSASITVEIKKDASMEKVLADVKNSVDAINSFPVDAEKPVVFEQKFRSDALSIMIFGNTDLYNLKYMAEQFRDELLAYPEISQIDIEGLPDLEFSIELSEADMRRFQLTFDEVAAAVRRANVNISGGKLETSYEEMLIRAWGRNYHASELLDIPVRGNPDGTVVYLKDIADVKEQWEDTPEKRYYNGRSALLVAIDQTDGEDILAIADIALRHVDSFNESHSSVTAQVVDDRTVPLRQRIELLTKNGIIGLILVIITLGFFLNLRMSFWVSISIPFSFAGMFIIAAFSGITINVMSLFGMIIVVGILVDDGIVVGENIFAHYERGKSPLRAAVDGATEVAVPVITSVTTTVIVFLAFFFIDGVMGKFIWQMALVVIASLVFSLIEAFLILPTHLAHSKGLHSHANDSNVRAKFEKAIQYLTHRIYAPTLKAALNNKWITVLIPLALTMTTVGILYGGLIGITFFPEIDADTVPINVSLVAGRQEADTDSLLARIETVVWQVNEEIKQEREDGRDVVIGVLRSVGSSSSRYGEASAGDGHTGSLLVLLLEGETRNMESYLIGNRIRETLGPLPEARTITFASGGRWGKPVSISLLGSDIEQMNKARDLLVAELENFSSLKDVSNSDEEGRREINITLKPRAYALGLTLQDIAGQVRQGFYGDEVQRIQRGKDEIRVWVRYSEKDRTELGNLDQMRIRTSSGEEYPFSELAQYEIERGITAINHLDRKREIKVEANQADATDDLPPILEAIELDVLPRIMGQVQGVKASFEGQSREQEKMVSSMKIVFPVALLCMFVLVVLVFRSYAQAILIFSLIPIGVLGAIWGHGIHGLQVNMMSFIGIIALSGIVINDSIVLVDQVNRYLRQGQSVRDAIYNAGIARLRPILLTTMTTSLGLAPLIMETSRQAQFLVPMAISVAYGLIFGTFILLLILPASILAFNSFRVNWAKLFLDYKGTPEAVEPAVKELQVPAIE